MIRGRVETDAQMILSQAFVYRKFKMIALNSFDNLRTTAFRRKVGEKNIS